MRESTLPQMVGHDSSWTRCLPPLSVLVSSVGRMGDQCPGNSDTGVCLECCSWEPDTRMLLNSCLVEVA